MGRKPRIFVSAVASEFGALRFDVAGLLTRLGFEPLLGDVSESDSHDQRPELRKQIDDCDGVLQIVGQDYGPEPTAIDPEFGRVSYAQFEFLYAQTHNKKTWIILARPGTRSGPPVPVDAAGDRGEQAKLQQAYRNRLEQAGHVWCEMADETELALTIERLANERTGLRTRFRRWPTIGRRHAAAVALVAALCGAWWLAVRWQNDRVVARELASIDPQQMRAQLEKSIGNTNEPRDSQRKPARRFASNAKNAGP